MMRSDKHFTNDDKPLLASTFSDLPEALNPGAETSDGALKEKLLRAYRERDKPLLATPDAHGPG